MDFRVVTARRSTVVLRFATSPCAWQWHKTLLFAPPMKLHVLTQLIISKVFVQSHFASVLVADSSALYEMQYSLL